MVRPEVIRRRLEMLQDYIEILEHIAQYSEDEFLGNPERYGSAERFLQLALESVLDMGSHVIADEALGTVNQSRDIPRVFRETGHDPQGIVGGALAPTSSRRSARFLGPSSFRCPSTTHPETPTKC